MQINVGADKTSAPTSNPYYTTPYMDNICM